MSNSEQELLTSECLLENINQVEKLLQKGIDPNFNCASFISNDLTKVIYFSSIGYRLLYQCLPWYILMYRYEIYLDYGN